MELDSLFKKMHKILEQVNNAVNVWLLKLLVELKKIKAFIWELIDKLSIIMIMLLMLWRDQNNFTFISSAVLVRTLAIGSSVQNWENSLRVLETTKLQFVYTRSKMPGNTLQEPQNGEATILLLQ